MKAVIYARYSSDNQTEASIEGQLRECMEFAERAEIDVVGNYIDRALTAKTDNRPEFQRMIKDSYKHAFDCIIVWKLDRFARNRYDSAHYKSLLKKNGVKVISAKESIGEGSDTTLQNVITFMITNLIIFYLINIMIYAIIYSNRISWRSTWQNIKHLKSLSPNMKESHPFKKGKQLDCSKEW